MNISDGSKVEYSKYVIIQRQQYMKLHKVTPKCIISLGKDQVDISEIVDKPYCKTFKMEPVAGKKRMFKLELCEGATSLSDEIFKEVTSGIDNREIEDDGSSQKLSTEEIINLRESGLSAHEIVETLVGNSKTFHNKTEYSQEKYLKKKEKKYFEYVTVLKPTFRLISDIIIKQGPSQVSGLRMDTLSQITSIANIRSGGTFLLYESGCQGLVAAHMLNTIGCDGTIIHTQPLLTPQKQAVQAMNFTNEQLDHLITINIQTLIKKLLTNGQVDEPQGKKPKWDLDTDKVKSILENKKCDGLVIVCREHPFNIFKTLIKYLGLSKSFVIYFPVREPLQDLFCELKSKHDVVCLRLTESWLRFYQVLPDRTHPHVNISGSGGYLLSGILVEP